jgi:Glycosyl hydrolase family 12
VPHMNIDTRTYRNDFDLDTGPYQNDFDTDTWLYQNGISPATGPNTGGFMSATWLDQGGYSPETWPYQNGFSPDRPTRHNGSVSSGGGRHRPPARHRKPPSRKMRRAATATAIGVAGGAAAVGFLYATGPQPMLTAANDLHAGTVTTAPRAGNAEGAAAALAAPAPSAAPVGHPERAYMPKHAAVSGKHATKTGKTGAPTTKHPAPTASHSTAPSPSSPPSSHAPSPSPSTQPTTPPSSSPSPTPTPTHSPTSPPPTSSGGSGTCTDPNFTTSSDFGQENIGPYTVSNNMWNVGGGGISQTLSACSASSWFVKANVAEDGGGVKTYPNSHYNYADPPAISSLSSVTSTFGSSIPGSGNFEDAYDIWLNGTAGAGGDEVMIWTDNHGESPAGSPVTSVTFDGESYTVWKGNNGPVSFVRNSNVSSGNVNLLEFFQWLINKGYEPANSKLYQVDYGVEIATTNGANETFGFNNFSVSSS